LCKLEGGEFTGDGARYRLVAEAQRIHLAHLFDPYLAVHASLIEPLPHQITAVYEEMIPRQPLPPSLQMTQVLVRPLDGILASIRLGVSNGRVEGLNTKVRSIIARSYGLHSAKATLALVMLACGPIDLKLPYERASLSK